MSEYKLCPNGHYYKGDHCPYCQPRSDNGKDSITIGRSSENDCIIADPHVNRIHCRIEKIGYERYLITDLQSVNGTYVNGERVDGSMEIGPYDEVRVGNSRVAWIHQFASIGRPEPLGGCVAPPEEFGHLSDVIESNEDFAPRERGNTTKTVEPEEKFHQCPNGHYYKGDGPCPYCQTKTKKSWDYKLKVCHNLHAYDAKINECPICGSSIVVDSFTQKASDTVLVTNIHLLKPIRVIQGEKELPQCNFIRVALPWGYKQWYCLKVHDSPYSDGMDVDPDKEILFGTATITGRELIRVCDIVLENRLLDQYVSTVDVDSDDLVQLANLIKRVTRNKIASQEKTLEFGHNVFHQTSIGDDGVPYFTVKVCPNGHGYDIGQTTCPFCDSDIVIESHESRAGFTLIITELQFKIDGNPISFHTAEVDGRRLTGDLCMSIEHCMPSFKYAYYISPRQTFNQQRLIVNPTSYVELKGDDLSISMTGMKFYQMCDELFDKNKEV